MTYLTEISTSTLGNQNIASALLVHTFTNTARLRKVWIDVFLDQVAGGVGNYTIYLTRQLSGAGSFYESVRADKPASAVTSIVFSSIALTIGATDVVRIYVVGLAADTTTPDIITKINEEWVDVNANGQVTVGTIANGVIAAATFAANALDAVWSTAARVLTAGTNIALAKGVGVTGFNDLSTAQVNAEVVDALATDTYAEPGQAAPAATAALTAKIGYLYKFLRNRITQTSTTLKVYNDDAVTVDQKAAVNDDGTTYDRGEIATGP